MGSLDALALVAVGCGACAAQLAAPRPRDAAGMEADYTLALRGFLVNLLCGDLVEACHPFLARDRFLDYATRGAVSSMLFQEEKMTRYDLL